MTRTWGRRLAAAAVLAAAVGPAALPPAPARAAGCSTDAGVTVVVDFHQLGGGVHQLCDAAGGGKTAQALFTDNGFALTMVASSPGFVCRVDGKPAADPCTTIPPANAYWGLFWSNGTSGTWTYATQGIGSLTVPAGGYVGFSWQGSQRTTPPGVVPAPHTQPSPSPTPRPSRSADGSATPKPSRAASSPAATPGATTPAPATSASSPSPSAGPSRSAKAKRRAKATRSPEVATTSAAASPVAAPADDSAGPPDGGEGGALPTWLVVAVLAVVGAGGAAAAYLRRRPGGGGGAP